MVFNFLLDVCCNNESIKKEHKRKKDSPSSFQDIRPNYILLVVENILEIVVHCQLVEYFENCGI